MRDRSGTIRTKKRVPDGVGGRRTTIMATGTKKDASQTVMLVAANPWDGVSIVSLVIPKPVASTDNSFET